MEFRLKQARTTPPADRTAARRPRSIAAGCELTNEDINEHTNKQTNQPTNEQDGSQYLLVKVNAVLQMILDGNQFARQDCHAV